MSAVLGVFGIDWRLLVINLINFGLLLGVLWYFLYKPLTRMLDLRREKVAQGVHNADLAERRLREIEGAETARLAQAATQADTLLSEARASATQKERDILARGEAAAASLLSEAQRQAEQTKREAIAKSKEEVAKLVVLGMEKLSHTRK